MLDKHAKRSGALTPNALPEAPRKAGLLAILLLARL
jgi:hypothetical protein